jgi:hypothetical protein
MAEFEGWVGEGKLLLETDALIFRGAARFAVRLVDITQVEAAEGWLEIGHAGGRARFDLGAAAERWAHAIRNPRTRVDKLDVKTTSKVAVDGVSESSFIDELGTRTPHVLDVQSTTELDLLFYQVDEPAGLTRLGVLRERIAQHGGIWVITPKGRRELGHDAIVAAAKAAGLIDTKTARFSDTHTALKLVIPRAQRRAVQT